MFWIEFACNGPVYRLRATRPATWVEGVLLCRRLGRLFRGWFWLEQVTRTSLIEKPDEATPEEVLDSNDAQDMLAAQTAEAALAVVVRRAEAVYATAN